MLEATARTLKRRVAAAFKFIHDRANRDRVAKIIAKSTGSSEAIASQTLDLFFQSERNVLPEPAEIDLKGLQQAIAMMAEAGTINEPLPAAERFVPCRRVRRAMVIIQSWKSASAWPRCRRCSTITLPAASNIARSSSDSDSTACAFAIRGRMLLRAEHAAMFRYVRNH